MKRIFYVISAALVISLLAVPAMAATQWNFGASIRYSTFWTEQDAGKHSLFDREGGGSLLKDDGSLDWGTQANSRLMFFMKSDRLDGFAELGYDFDDNKVWTRELWGRYHINENMSVIVGQQHQLFNSFISNQVWESDLNMNGIGTSFRPPTPKITLTYNGFSFALSKHSNDRVSDLKEQTANRFSAAWGGIAGTGLTADVNTYLPQLQASYEYKSDVWRAQVFGAFQTMRLKDVRLHYNSGLDYIGLGNKTINSWLVGVDGDISFGPLFLGAHASVGQNWADAGWNYTDLGIDDHNSLGADYFSSFGVMPRLRTSGYGSPVSSKWENTTSVMASIVAAYQLTENWRFEVGGGYRYDENKVFEKDSSIWNVYLQAAYTVTPGFTITPEIGYIDLGRNVWSGKDQGYIWYAGAQWVMNF